jgi:hypothetical protein
MVSSTAAARRAGSPCSSCSVAGRGGLRAAHGAAVGVTARRPVFAPGQLPHGIDVAGHLSQSVLHDAGGASAMRCAPLDPGVGAAVRALGTTSAGPGRIEHLTSAAGAGRQPEKRAPATSMLPKNIAKIMTSSTRLRLRTEVSVLIGGACGK